MASMPPPSYGQIARGGLRRYLFLAVFTIFLLFLLQRSFYPSDSASLSSDSNQPSATYHDDRFRWSELPIHYPPNSIVPLPKGKSKSLPRVQHKFEAETTTDKAQRLKRQAAVKKVFGKAWKSYKKYAWLKDELAPVTGLSRNTFGGWAATLVDSLDTLHIMDMKDELDEAVAALSKIDFGKPDEDTLNTFETTIRYLGGFISAFELSHKIELLDKAIEVGEMLYVPFDTPNRMPVTRWDWQPAKGGQHQKASSNALVAEIGSLTLEFTRLSQLTNNPKWFDAVQRISEVFYNQQNQTRLPGMWPVLVNAQMADFTNDGGFTLGGMSDSLYEYFPKEYALLGGLDDMYKDLYINSMKTAIKYAFFRPMVPDEADILISGNVRADNPDSPQLDPQGQHLTCFAGGMLALGGRLFDLPEHVTLGRKLVDGCIWAYNNSQLGIMPETFYMVPCASKESCPWNEASWHHALVHKAGLSDVSLAPVFIAERRLNPGFVDVTDRRYILRPEAIESVFILYRITGDKSLQDIAWKMFENIDKYTKTDYANTALDDVTMNPPPMSDRMESFWTAETLKYFYLIFSEPDLISLDDYVFNTEAHPFRRPK